LSYVEKQIADQNSSTIKNTQAGQSGAVPLPDPAPWTGAPKAGTVGKPDDLQYVNDWNAPLFNQRNDATMADLVNDSMKHGHGTNGTSYGD
jgi:hypothetical protein